MEFKLAFHSLKHKNTQGRINQWKKLYKKDHMKFWNLEMKVEEYLQQEVLPASHFWAVCNFPGIQSEELAELYSLDPSKLVSGEDKTFIKLSKRARTYVDNNMDMIIFLENFFNELQVKQWNV